MIFKLAWRNLWRNKNRTLITIASVFFAVVLSILIAAIQRGAMDQLVRNVVSFYSSYIQIHKKGYFNEQTLDNVLDVNDSLLATIRAQKNVIKASPRIETFVLASSGNNTEGCMMCGIIPSQERELIQLGKKVTAGNYMADTLTGVIIAEGLAGKLKLKLNDTILLLGQGYEGVTAADKYPIKTIVTFGSPQLNDRMLFMPLMQAQHFLGADGKATSIVVSVDESRALPEIKKDISANLTPAYEVITWDEMIPEVVQLVKTKEGSELIVTLLLYMLVSFGIFATLLMMMAERKYELGMLMAIGMKKSQLARMVMLESVFVSIVGCIVGIAASIPLIYYLSVHPITFGGTMKKMYESYGFEATIPAATHPFIFYQQAIIIVIVSLVLSVYPLYRIYTMNALKAMRK